ncbi:cytidine deaminase [Roseateles sp. BYS180W]|uniref:Cytidine deaminase n=1 Tax=Roseateles rivi TaxID=3299028 RepID=A0ABW7FSW5_9BURK
MALLLPPDLTPALVAQLLQAATAARLRAYAPYSGYAVGAAVLDLQGGIHAGCNIENAAYPQGWCAEATALGQMVLAGQTQARAMLVLGRGPEIITPCGGCRQKLREFAQPSVFHVLAADPEGLRQVWTLEQLLPHSFGPEHLRSSQG